MGSRVVAYLTAGYPSPDAFLEVASRIAPYVRAYEIGFPPRVAKYDGPVIRRSYAMVKGSAEELMALAAQVRGEKYALIYYDDIMEDPEAFLRLASSSGFAGCLFPDVIIDHHRIAEKIFSRVREAGLRNAVFVSPSVPDSIIRTAAAWADAFLYLGVRPATGIPTPVSVERLIRRVREIYGGTLVVGFGLRDDEIRAAIEAGADAVAVGSSILRALELGPEAAEAEVRRVAGIAGD